MRTFSRWMPPVPPSAPLSPWLGIGVAAGALSLVALVFPKVWLAVAGYLALNAWAWRSEEARIRARHAERARDDIGTFARAFARRGPEPFDAWVIRATWEALAVELTPGGPRAPVRPDDDLEELFDIEDVEPLATAIAWRARRSARVWQVDPALLDDVRTVRDLVALVARQPRLAADGIGRP